jgi:hypothetical protein
MRARIELTRLQRLRNTDSIFFDHIIEAIYLEIEKVENPYVNKPVTSDAFWGFVRCHYKILSLLAENSKPKVVANSEQVTDRAL